MTDSEQVLVPGPSGGLPTHIERRTRIANRVLGELERRDTEVDPIVQTTFGRI